MQRDAINQTCPVTKEEMRNKRIHKFSFFIRRDTGRNEAGRKIKSENRGVFGVRRGEAAFNTQVIKVLFRSVM